MTLHAWEVFDPRDGVPRYRVPYAWIARVLARYYGLDYARTGQGWGSTLTQRGR